MCFSSGRIERRDLVSVIVVSPPNRLLILSMCFSSGRIERRDLVDWTTKLKLKTQPSFKLIHNFNIAQSL
ncbi:hypothetical protein TorRG33x02_258560 [Trema orientale]|uniref:Uncharacterized protein n=1 Tax=Trema orientale TaxID=63057 RepID=A0A2P5D8Q9_TREOI|nr:hypothetical protein TorRG33x02_258560 [Trema orientale]